MDLKSLKTNINSDEYQEYIQSIITKFNENISLCVKFFYFGEYSKENNIIKKEILSAVCFALSDNKFVNSILTEEIIKNKIIEKIEEMEKFCTYENNRISSSSSYDDLDLNSYL